MTRRFAHLVLLVCATIVAPTSSASAQQPAATPPLTVDQVIADLVQQGDRASKIPNVKQPYSDAVSNSAGGSILHLVAGQLVDKEAYKTLADILMVSTGTQVGAGSATSGSTSVTTKGLVPAILGFAVEHGAIAEDVNKNIVTFRASPAGFVKALQGEGLLDIYEDYSRDAGFRLASRFSAAVSFDTSLGDTPGTLQANARQVKSWSIDATLLNHRDPRAKGYGQEWRALAAQQGPALISARDALDQALQKWPSFTEWQTALVDRVRHEVDEPWATDHNTAAVNVRMKAILTSELAGLAKLPAPDASVNAAMASYVAKLASVGRARNDIYAYANKGPIATFDWTTTRDEKLPDLYTLTGVFQTSFATSRTDDFTSNVAVRVYRVVPAGGTGHLKDVSVSAEWDRPLGRVLEIPFVFSASTKYQYIPKDVPVPAAGAAALAPQGHLILGQAKLTIPLKSGVRIPLSVTVANRTELIKEKDVRANFGVTFDLDSFVAAVKSR